MIAPNYLFNLPRSKIGPKKFVCRALKVAAIFTWGVGCVWLRERPPIMSGVLGLLEMGFLQLLSRMKMRNEDPIIVISDAQPSLN